MQIKLHCCLSANGEVALFGDKPRWSEELGAYVSKSGEIQLEGKSNLFLQEFVRDRLGENETAAILLTCEAISYE